MEYCSTIKKKEVLLLAGKWTELEDIMSSEASFLHGGGRREGTRGRALERGLGLRMGLRCPPNHWTDPERLTMPRSADYHGEKAEDGTLNFVVFENSHHTQFCSLKTC
jgi:hypothetical protein